MPQRLISRFLRPEAFTAVVVVNDFEEARYNLFASPVYSARRHEWIVIDNVNNKAGDSMSRLYFEAASVARNDLVFFLHQDVWLPEAWEQQMYHTLAKVERMDPSWGVVGAVGVVSFDVPGQPFRGHWAGVAGYEGDEPIKRLGPPPCEVQSLDELWLGYRRSRGLAFDPDMPGWHCYGIDLCLAAQSMGFKSYALDALTWHKYKNNKGERILRRQDSEKIVARGTPEWKAGADLSKSYVRAKWARYLPFRSTSMEWHLT